MRLPNFIIARTSSALVLIVIFIFITLSKSLRPRNRISRAGRQSKTVHSMANYHFFAALLARVELFRHQVLLGALVGAVFGISRCTVTKLNKKRKAAGAVGSGNQPVKATQGRVTAWEGLRVWKNGFWIKTKHPWCNKYQIHWREKAVKIFIWFFCTEELLARI